MLNFLVIILSKMLNPNFAIKIFAAVFFYTLVSAQSFEFRSYFESDGLNSSRVYDVLQDDSGKMWFAARNGISVFDGYNWDVFTTNNTGLTNDYYRLKKDSDGGIWALSSSPNLWVSYYKSGEWSKYQISNSPKSMLPTDFEVLTNEPDTIIVVGTYSNGVFISKNGTTQQISKSEGLRGNRVYSIEVDDDNIYVMTDGGVSVINNGFVENTFGEDNKLPFEKVYAIKFDAANNQVFVVGETTLGRIINGKYELLVSGKFDQSKFRNNRVIEPVIFLNQFLFFGNEFNLFVYGFTSGKFSVLGKSAGLHQDGANSIYKDFENNLWVVGARGVTKARLLAFKNYRSESGLLADEVSSIVQRNDGALIFGHTNGMTIFKNEEFTKIEYYDKSTSEYKRDKTLDLTADSLGNVYLAAEKLGFGKLALDGRLSFFKMESGFKSAYSIEINKKGEIFGSSEGALYKLVNEKFIPLTVPKKFQRNIFRKIFFDNEDNIYITTNLNGLIYIDVNTWEWNNFVSLSNSAANNIYNLMISGDTVYCGTAAGLFKLDDDTLSQLKLNGEAIMRPVYSINKFNGTIWIGTDNGMAVFHSDHISNYTYRNGLSGNEINRDAVLVDEKNNLWIGNDGGLSLYKPEYDIMDYTDPPRIYIENIFTRDGDLTPDESGFYTTYSNDIFFKISIISFIDETENEFKVKLEGYDEDWMVHKSSPDNLIRYTNLNPGSYTLKLNGINAFNNASLIEKSAAIRILKPFYDQWWFYTISIAGVIILLFVAIRYHQRKKYYSKLENEVKRRTKLLKDSEERYRSLVENIQDGVFLIYDRKIQFCNTALANLAGYTVKELLENEISIFIAPEDREMVMKRLERRTKGEELIDEYNFRVLHKDGSTRIFVNIHVGTFVFDNKLALIGTLKNITESVKSREELRKLSTAVDQSPVGIVITDKQGIIEYANPRFEMMTGYKTREVYGKPISLLKSGLLNDEVYEELWSNIKMGKVWKGELQNKRKDGSIYWVSTSVSPLQNENGEIEHLLSIQEDITFEKYAEDEIRQNKKLIDSMLNNIPLVVFVLDKAGRIKLARGKFLEIFGFDQNNLVGRSSEAVVRRYKAIQSDIKRALKGERFKNVRNVEDYKFEISYSPIFGDGQKILGTIGVAYDISDRINIEKELLAAKTEAEKSNKLKSDFLAQMSHEIRTPVNSIMSFSSLLKEQLHETVPEELSESFNIIENGGRRLIRTIDLILDMSQIQSGAYNPNFSSVDLHEDILSKICKEISITASNKDLLFQYSNKSASSNVYGDSYTIGQIFINLLENAVKYTAKGEVSVLLKSEQANLVVEISDTGIGIREEFIPQLFTPFSQEESGYTRKFEGNGLGLALVKRYAELNNAIIKVKSEKGAGTLFTVIFKKYS